MEEHSEQEEEKVDPSVQPNRHRLSPRVATKAWTSGSLTWVFGSALVTLVQAALGARLFDNLPIGIGGIVTALLPAVLNFFATWLAKNKPV